MATHLLQNVDVSYLDELLDEDGVLVIKDASFYDSIPQEHLALWCHQHGIYCLVTTELVDWCKQQIEGQNAIEIGAGNGSLGRALGIPVTDSRMHERPDVALLYRLQGQPVTTYPDHIVEMDASAAVSYYKPDVVIGCWITHIFNEEDSWRGGNMYGVDERILLQNVKKYIVIGNRTVHKNKRILSREHDEFQFPWLKSRSLNIDDNLIYVWRNNEQFADR